MNYVYMLVLYGLEPGMNRGKSVRDKKDKRMLYVQRYDPSGWKLSVSQSADRAASPLARS